MKKKIFFKGSRGELVPEYGYKKNPREGFKKVKRSIDEISQVGAVAGDVTLFEGYIDGANGLMRWQNLGEMTSCIQRKKEARKLLKELEVMFG